MQEWGDQLLTGSDSMTSSSPMKLDNHRFSGYLRYVTCSHEMIDKSRHVVPRFSLKTVVRVNLGEIEIFALCRSSFIFTPYTCSFLLYSTYKCFKFCKWSTYWSIRHWEMTPKWPIFTEGLLSVTRAEPHVSHTKTKVTVSRCEL